MAITRQWAYKNKEIERIVLSGLEKIDLGQEPLWLLLRPTAGVGVCVCVCGGGGGGVRGCPLSRLW